MADDPRANAVMEGKLPPSQIPPASHPGEPVIPHAPTPPRFRLCSCRQCSPQRRHHWYCCMCGQGPIAYVARTPFFIKNWYEPGGVRGLAHACCSEPCRVGYLTLLNIVPGVNDHEPRGADSAQDRRVVAADSD